MVFRQNEALSANDLLDFRAALAAYGPGAVPPSTNCTAQQLSQGPGGLPVG